MAAIPPIRETVYDRYEAGHAETFDSTPAEASADVAPVADAEFTIGAEVAHVRRVTVQLKDGNGDDVALPAAAHIWWADAADGSISAYTQYGPVDSALIATKGAVVSPNNSIGGPGVGSAWGAAANNQSLIVTVLTTGGAFDVDAENDAAATWYLCVLLPTGKLVVSDPITFAG